MDVQKQRKSHSGQEVHSMVHLCRNCGWPYPNPHPSAKHRRAHNRVCGTVEGYKLTVDSGSHSNVAEDYTDHEYDHEHSDEDHHSPTMDRSLDDGGSKEITERSDASKEEAFLDAAMHFPDGAPTPQVEASSFTVNEAIGDDNKDLVVDLKGLQSHEDCTTIEEFGIETSDSSNSSMQNLQEHRNAFQELSDPEITEPSAGSAEQGETKFVQAPDDFLGQSNGVAAPSSLDVGFETSIDFSAKADVHADSEMVNKQLSEDSVKEGDTIANQNALPTSSLPTKDAGVNFATATNQEFASMEEGQLDAVSSAYQSQTLDFVSSGKFSAENLQEDTNFQTCVVPKDILVFEQPDELIEGYKDYSAPRLHLPEDTALSNNILRKEDLLAPVSEDRSLSEMKVQKEDIEVPSSDCILPEYKFVSDDDFKELKEDVPIIQDVVMYEQIVTSLETNGDHAFFKSEDSEAKETDPDLSTVNLPVDSSMSVSREIEAPEISKGIGENNLSESDKKHCSIAPEMLVQKNDAQDKSMTNLIEVERASAMTQPKTERAVVTEIETTEGCFEENNNLKVVAAEYIVPAFAAEPTNFAGDSDHDTANVTEDVECSEEKRESVRNGEINPESTIKYQVVDIEVVQSIDAISSGQGSVAVETCQAHDPSVTTPEIPAEDEDLDNFVKAETVAVETCQAHDPSVTTPEIPAEDEDLDNFVKAEPVAVETFQAHDPSVTTPEIPGEDEDLDNFVKADPVASAPEHSIDLNSQTDSLEANWGSISVLSTQSDPSIATESELLTPVHEVAPIEARESITEAEGKGSEKTDAFEAPSFMTLVKQGVRANQTGGALTQQEGKNNEEIISNQGAGKHHSPLKNLLVEATQESKLKSPSQKDSFALAQKDQTAPVTTVGKILAADDHKAGSSVKEWDSPARYPADIKRERRKVKGHWMPFICCSSVN